MAGVSLPALTRCLVEKEDIIDELWHGKKLLTAASAAYLNELRIRVARSRHTILG